TFEQHESHFIFIAHSLHHSLRVNSPTRVASHDEFLRNVELIDLVGKAIDHARTIVFRYRHNIRVAGAQGRCRRSVATEENSDLPLNLRTLVSECRNACKRECCQQKCFVHPPSKANNSMSEFRLRRPPNQLRST